MNLIILLDKLTSLLIMKLEVTDAGIVTSTSSSSADRGKILVVSFDGFKELYNGLGLDLSTLVDSDNLTFLFTYLYRAYAGVILQLVS